MLAAALLGSLAAGGGPVFHPQTSGTVERLRGVSVLGGEIVWATGTKGTVLRTTDAGATWVRRRVPGAEALDFRDVEAVESAHAYVLAIGPGDASRIYVTVDGGDTWVESFRN